LKEDKDLQFVDLGTNLGVYALAVAKMGRNVIAVDPYEYGKWACK
jgi:methylase of polypeptide subunit release factors